MTSESGIQAFGQVWNDVLPGTDADLQELEDAAGAPLPEDLKAFLKQCGGGWPENNFYEADDCEAFELGIGYVLPLVDPDGPNSAREVMERYRANQDLPADFIPFALDLGNTNPICCRLGPNDIVQYTSEDEKEPVRFVAVSLETFLTRLIESPF